ncbi:MAG: hypothetical protein GF419_13895 [Ignavibacteriales bacterium]|nr:hypothetical protein [Ignavibacteriales bacterium]
MALSLIVAIVTQLLSLPSLLVPEVVVPFWALVALAFGWFGREGWAMILESARRLLRRYNELSPAYKAVVLGTSAIVLGAGVIAWFAAPTTVDADHYHLSRVEFWFQNGNIELHPNLDARQAYFSPFYEYILLHWRLLSDDVFLLNLVGYFFFVCLGVVASLFAKDLGVKGKGQVATAALILTIPQSIYQSFIIKNEMALAFYLLAFVFYGFRSINAESPRSFEVLCAASALALAALTKGSAAMFALPFALWFGYKYLRVFSLKGGANVATTFLLIGFSVNGWFYVNNYLISGHPTGIQKFSNAGIQSDYDAWTNDSDNVVYGAFQEPALEASFSKYSGVGSDDPRAYLSVLSKNIAINIYTPVQPINDIIEDVTLAFHSRILRYPLFNNVTHAPYLSKRWWLPTELFFTTYHTPNTHTMILLFVGIILYWKLPRKEKHWVAITVLLWGTVLIILSMSGLKWSLNRPRYFLAPLALATPAIAAILIKTNLHRFVILGILFFSLVYSAALLTLNNTFGFYPITKVAQLYMGMVAPHVLSDDDYASLKKCAAQKEASPTDLDSFYVDNDGYRTRGELTSQQASQLAMILNECNLFPYPKTFGVTEDERIVSFAFGHYFDHKRLGSILKERGLTRFGAITTVTAANWYALQRTLPYEFELRQAVFFEEGVNLSNFKKDFYYQAAYAFRFSDDIRKLYPEENIKEYITFNGVQIIIFKEETNKRFILG